jgi:hypothetical protein
VVGNHDLIAECQSRLHRPQHTVDPGSGIRHKNKAVAVGAYKLGKLAPTPLQGGLEIPHHEPDRVPLHLGSPRLLTLEHFDGTCAKRAVIEMNYIRVEHPAIHPPTLSQSPHLAGAMGNVVLLGGAMSGRAYTDLT